MRLKMAKNSIFAYLLRSPWWISLSLAAIVGLGLRFTLPDRYALFSLSFALPFLVIGIIAGWRELRLPSAGKVASTMERLLAMNWRDFQSLMERAFQHNGYSVSRLQGAADFRLIKAGRVSVVSCKRWKASSHGIEALRELDAAREAQDAHEAIYVAAGEITENAVRFAAAQKIRLMTGQELTQLLAGVK